MQAQKKLPKQLALFKKSSLAYGGELLKTRRGRSHGRPLDSKNTMHLVLRSSLAKGEWSFKTSKNSKIIKDVIETFSKKYGIRILSLANVGNHLHLQIKLSKVITYKAFIRAITSAIAMKITGVSRWKEKSYQGRFWDLRPFTRVVRGYKAFLTLKDYILLNELEGFGVKRTHARLLIQNQGHRFAREFLRTAGP